MEIRVPYAVNMFQNIESYSNSRTPVNAIRMFAFASAVLITAFLLRVIVYAVFVESPPRDAAAVEIVHRQPTQD